MAKLEFRALSGETVSAFGKRGRQLQVDSSMSRRSESGRSLDAVLGPYWFSNAGLGDGVAAASSPHARLQATT